MTKLGFLSYAALLLAFLGFCCFVQLILGDRISADILMAKEFLDRNNSKGAVDCLSKVLTNNPNNVKALNMRAAAFILARDYHAALADCDKAIALEPNFSTGYIQRAIANEHLDRYQKALEDLNRVVLLQSDRYESYLERAIVLEKLNRYQEALNDCGRAILLAPKHGPVYLKRAIVNLFLDDFEKVVDDCSTAIRLDPKINQAYMVRAKAYQELGLYKNEINDLDWFISSDPGSLEAYKMRAYACYKLGLLKECVSNSQMVIKTLPNSQDDYRLCATALEEAGLFRQALMPRTKLIELNKNSAVAWSDRARLYQHIFEFSHAKSNWLMAKGLASKEEWASIKLNNPYLEFRDDITSNGSLTKSKTQSTILPFLRQNCNHISVPVLLNNRASKFLVDTGCSYTNVWRGRSKQQELKSTGTIKDVKPNSKEYTVELVPLKELTIDKIHWKEVDVPVSDGLSPHQELDGTLGGNLLEHYIVTVNFKNRQLLLESLYHPPLGKRTTEVPLIVRNHKPYCMVTLDGQTSCLALLDTGCSINLTPDSFLSPEIASKFRYQHEVSGPWLGNLKSEKVKLQKLELNHLSFSAVPFYVFKAKEAPKIAGTIILGNDFLGQFDAITFDYPGRKVVFVHSAKR